MEKIVRHFHQHLWLKPRVMPFFIFGLIIPAHLFAQTDTSKKDTARKLDQVTVSSPAVPRLQAITPSQTISSNEFSRYNALNVADAIRDFAGVIIKDYGGIGGLKTVSVRGLGANHTAVLYDGIELNDAENGQVDLSKLNLNNLQRITLYNAQPPEICMPARSFASATVLAITTVKPELSSNKPYAITAGIKTGSFGLVNPYIQWQQRIDKNWSFIINSYLENANGHYKYKGEVNHEDSIQTRNNAGINAQQIDGALYWAKNDSNKFDLHVNYYNSDRGLPGAVVFNATPSNQRLWDRDFFAQAGYERIWKSGIYLLLNTKASQSFLHYLNPDVAGIDDGIDQRFTQRELYQSVALAYHITTNWEIAYSADASLSNLGILFNYPDPSFPDPTRLTVLNALASNFNIGKFRLQGSLLNTNITETVKRNTAASPLNKFSPTLMATYQPFENSNFQLRGFYKNIFRNPTFDELYYQQVGNPDLKPEFTNQFDIGTTYTKGFNGFLDYIAFTADAYYNHVTNKIVFIPKDAYNGSIRNYGKVDIKGLDIGIKTQVNLTGDMKGSLVVNYTHQQALNVTDPASSIYLNQLPYTPKSTLALNAGITYKQAGFYYNQIISSSRFYTNDNIPYTNPTTPNDYIPGYSTSDASLVYHFSVNGKPIATSFEANNIFNKSYVIVQSYPMPGRSYRISFQITI